MSSVKDKAAAAAQTVNPTPSAWGHILGIGAFLVIVVFIPAWGETFTMPKVVLLTAFALAAAPLIWTRWHNLTTHRVPVILAAAFAGLALVSQFLSGAPQLVSLWGEWLRRTGTITALALALLLITASLLTRREMRALLAWVAWAGVPATAYGLIQVAGADPLEWTDQGWVVATFGNPNFAAAGLAMLALLTAGLAAFGDYRTLWRILMVPLAALEAFVALQTGSSQALFALAAGIGAGALVWLMRGDGPNRLRSVLGLTAIGVVGAVLTVAALFGIGPLVSAISSDTLMFRQWYWGAALGMAGSHPIVGVGPDGYGRFYGEFRSEQAAEMFTLGASAAHDVPLQWAATLGIPAALVYVALVAAVAIVVIRRLWAQGGEASPLVIPVFAVWAAYQVQSLVSIDAIPIAMLGWLTTGVLLTVSRPETTPGATNIGSWVAAGALGLVGVLVWLPATLASNASKTVVQGTTEADVLQAISLVEGTTLPCDPSVRVGRWMVDVAASEPTIMAVFTGAEADNRCYGLVNAAADFAIQLERPEQALALAEQAVAIDPLNYTTWLLLARAENLNGNDPEARSALQRAEDINPNAVAEIEAISEDLGLS